MLPSHENILEDLPPGASVSTDWRGTTITMPRMYDPSKGSCLVDRSISNIVQRSAPFSRLYFSAFRDPGAKILDKRSIIVFIDGACLDNGSPAARASVGAFFGPASPHNISELLPHSEPQTSQRAEIHAALRALQVAQDAVGDDFSVSRIVLASDSAYVVKSMTQWVFTWRKNGWKNSDGGALVNGDTLKELDSMIEDMAEDGLEVEFWAIPREENVEADRLASSACRR
ncbi:ribonuclease H-like domain-containing protein [Lyophyllum atratum]|nr:ribonuclease H-like domain-containing protein [Lyophyllum atratum]